jgi:uncharacterized protein (TIRG00374 family)
MRVRSIVVTLLAFALFCWFLRGTDLRDVWGQVQHARMDLIVLSLVCVGVTYVFRAIRWQCLLAPLGPTRLRTAFRTTIIGFAALSLLPARLGDPLRAYLLARQERLSAPATFATVVMERVFDLVGVLALLGIFLWGFADPGSLPPEAAGPLAQVKFAAAVLSAVSVALFGVMRVLAAHPERIGGLVLTLARVLPKKIATRLADIARVLSLGFAASRSPRTMALAVAWSFPVWLAIAAEAWLVTRAFGLELPFTGSFLLQAFLVLGVAVPVPGGVGSYHEAYRYSMTTFFGAASHQAVAAAVVLHLVSFIPVVIVGIYFMHQDGLSFGGLQDLASEAREKEKPPSDEVPILREPGR